MKPNYGPKPILNRWASLVRRVFAIVFFAMCFGLLASDQPAYADESDLIAAQMSSYSDLVLFKPDEVKTIDARTSSDTWFRMDFDEDSIATIHVSQSIISSSGYVSYQLRYADESGIENEIVTLSSFDDVEWSLPFPKGSYYFEVLVSSRCGGGSRVEVSYHVEDKAIPSDGHKHVFEQLGYRTGMASVSAGDHFVGTLSGLCCSQDVDTFELNISRKDKYFLDIVTNEEAFPTVGLCDSPDATNAIVMASGIGSRHTLNLGELKPGTYYVKIQNRGGNHTLGWNGMYHVSVREGKLANPLEVKAKTVKADIGYGEKKLTVKRAKAFDVKNAKGKVSFKVSKYVTKKAKGAINVSKAGDVTVKKGAAEGVYKIRVKATAAGDGDYKSKSKTVTVTVKVLRFANAKAALGKTIKLELGGRARFDVPRRGTVTFRSTVPSKALEFTLYDSKGKLIWHTDMYGFITRALPSKTPQYQLNLEKGRYYLVAQASSGESGTVKLTSSFRKNDKCLVIPHYTVSSASRLVLGKTYFGCADKTSYRDERGRFVGSWEESNYVKFDLPEKGSYRIYVCNFGRFIEYGVFGCYSQKRSAQLGYWHDLRVSDFHKTGKKNFYYIDLTAEKSGTIWIRINGESLDGRQLPFTIKMVKA